MASLDKTFLETAGALADPGRVHATLRSLAVRVRRASRGEGAEPHELRELARQICQFRRTLRDQFGADVRTWLANLQREVEALQAPAFALADDACREETQVTGSIA